MIEHEEHTEEDFEPIFSIEAENIVVAINEDEKHNDIIVNDTRKIITV